MSCRSKRRRHCRPSSEELSHATAHANLRAWPREGTSAPAPLSRPLASGVSGVDGRPSEPPASGDSRGGIPAEARCRPDHAHTRTAERRATLSHST
eukprot:14769613-Alexandrium_andersonii.AAC.1